MYSQDEKFKSKIKFAGLWVEYDIGFYNIKRGDIATINQKLVVINKLASVFESIMVRLIQKKMTLEDIFGRIEDKGYFISLQYLKEILDYKSPTNKLIERTFYILCYSPNRNEKIREKYLRAILIQKTFGKELTDGEINKFVEDNLKIYEKKIFKNLYFEDIKKRLLEIEKKLVEVETIVNRLEAFRVTLYKLKDNITN